MSQSGRFCILLSLVVGLSEASQKEALVPKKCCQPPLFQITNTDIRSYGAEVVVQTQVFVDYMREIQVNKVFHQNRKTGERTFKSRVVMDFANGWMYEFPNERSLYTPVCYKVSLPILMSLQCVPGWATYVGSDYIGPERTLIDIWSVDQEDINVNLTYAFTREQCVPVFQVQKGRLDPEKIVVDSAVIQTDFSATIADTTVFDFPNDCVPAIKNVDLGYSWGAISDP